MSQTTLYRLFDASDQLVYVGISGRGAHRLMEHARRSRWWGRIARATFEHFVERREALAAERQVIRAESPLANCHGLGARAPREETGFLGALNVLRSDARTRAVAFRICTAETIALLRAHGLEPS